MRLVKVLAERHFSLTRTSPAADRTGGTFAIRIERPLSVRWLRHLPSVFHRLVLVFQTDSVMPHRLVDAPR